MHHLPRNLHGDNRARRVAALLLVVLGFPVTKTNAAEPEEAAHHVTAVRFWSLGGVTRIAIETDGDFQVKSDRLDNPDRLFFDLTGTRPTLGRKGMTTFRFRIIF